MKEGYRLLGDFIRQVDVRNTDGKEENLLGVSVQKMFIPSIAMLWSSIFVTLVAKKYHESVTLPSGLRMVYDNH